MPCICAVADAFHLPVRRQTRVGMAVHQTRQQIKSRQIQDLGSLCQKSASDLFDHPVFTEHVPTKGASSVWGNMVAFLSNNIAVLPLSYAR